MAGDVSNQEIAKRIALTLRPLPHYSGSEQAVVTYSGLQNLRNEITYALDKKDARIKRLREALQTVVGEGHSQNCQIMKPTYRPNYECHVEIAEEALAQDDKDAK